MRYNLKFAEALHKTDIGLDGVIEALGGEPPVPPNPKTVVMYENGDIAEYLIEGELGENLISDKNNAVKVEIGMAVTSIGYRAFHNCSKLTEVTIPSSVTSIGNYAFSSCPGLTSIEIPDSVVNINDRMCFGCTSLTSITVDPNNSTYDSRNNCNAIINTSSNELIAGCKNTIIPNGVTSIGNYAFYRCPDLTSITIPDGVTIIASYAFSSCPDLTSITIPNGVTRIGDSAFAGCTSLTSITIPDSVTRIGNYAFYSCSVLTPVTIPGNVASIGMSAFYGCFSMTSITFDNKIKSQVQGMTTYPWSLHSGCVIHCTDGDITI